MIDSKSEWFNQTNVVFQQVLEQVAANLNEIHSVHYSTRYWNIFLGSWLQRFVHMVMFRLYEIESNKEISIATRGFSPANTLIEFAELAKSLRAKTTRPSKCSRMAGRKSLDRQFYFDAQVAIRGCCVSNFKY